MLRTSQKTIIFLQGILYVAILAAADELSKHAPPMIGHHDGHEHKPSINDQLRLGRPDGHERHLATDGNPIFGGDDGHERQLLTGSPPVFGGDDGHELNHDRTRRPPDNTEVEDTEDRDGDRDADQSEDKESKGEEPTVSVPELGKRDGHEYDECSRRPLCKMYCAHGMQTDEVGCHVCECLPDPCELMSCAYGSQCHPLEVCKIHPCTQLMAECIPNKCEGPEPMCANLCPNGYKQNEDGCMICECMSVCATQMCQNQCPTGYRNNEYGCMTCNCNGETSETRTGTTETCLGKRCEEGQVCRKSLDETDSALCVPKPLCEISRDELARGMGLMVRGTPMSFVPSCDTDGSFRPVQCSSSGNECWCVDDRGLEVNDTRIVDASSTKQPKCDRKVTEQMNIRMYLVITHHIDVIHDKDSLSSVIIEHISMWMLLEPDFIKLTKMEPEKDAKNDSQTLVLVELIVVHHGIADLQSSAEYMKRRMKENCDVPLPGGGVMKPKPDTVQTIPNYDHSFKPEKQGNDDRYVKCLGYKISHSLYVSICVTTSICLLAFAVAVICLCVCKSRRAHRGTLQFRHREFVNQLSIEKSGVENEYVKSVYKPLDDKVALQV